MSASTRSRKTTWIRCWESISEELSTEDLDELEKQRRQLKEEVAMREVPQRLASPSEETP